MNAENTLRLKKIIPHQLCARQISIHYMEKATIKNPPNTHSCSTFNNGCPMPEPNME